MQSRLRLPQPETMSREQRPVYDEVLATRGNASGPFLAWLHSPQFADRAQKLGAFCRYGTTLSLEESELLILHVASAYGCTAEQQIHEPIALKAGMADHVVQAIREGQIPRLDNPRHAVLAEFARELTSTKRLGDALYRNAIEVLGDQALVEAVGIIGYYALVAYTLNAFEMSA